MLFNFFDNSLIDLGIKDTLSAIENFDFSTIQAGYAEKNFGGPKNTETLTLR